MKNFGTVCAVVAGTLLAACASPPATTEFGKNFNIQAAASLVPGKSTKSEIIQNVGELRTPEIFTAKKDTAGKELPSPMVIEYANYYYSNKVAKAAEENLRASRTMSVHFIGTTLAYYRTSSTFAGESTDFDENKVSKISKGMSEADVLALMGTPSGRGIYPFTPDPDGTSILYHWLAMNTATGKFHTKSFSVYFDAKKKVSDFDLKVNVK